LQLSSDFLEPFLSGDRPIDFQPQACTRSVAASACGDGNWIIGKRTDNFAVA
jgi:hypothetical protein